MPTAPNGTSNMPTAPSRPAPTIARHGPTRRTTPPAAGPSRPVMSRAKSTQPSDATESPLPRANAGRNVKSMREPVLITSRCAISGGSARRTAGLNGLSARALLERAANRVLRIRVVLSNGPSVAA